MTNANPASRELSCTFGMRKVLSLTVLSLLIAGLAYCVWWRSNGSLVERYGVSTRGTLLDVLSLLSREDFRRLDSLPIGIDPIPVTQVPNLKVFAKTSLSYDEWGRELVIYKRLIGADSALIIYSRGKNGVFENGFGDDIYLIWSLKPRNHHDEDAMIFSQGKRL